MKIAHGNLLWVAAIATLFLAFSIPAEAQLRAPRGGTKPPPPTISSNAPVVSRS